MTRAAGAGSITKLKNGRLWVRVWIGKKREPFGTYPTQEEAESVLAGVLERLAAGEAVPKDVVSLLSFEPQFMNHRRKRRKDPGTDQSRWTLHIATAPFATKPLRAVEQREIQLWVDDLYDVVARDKRGERKISRQTIKHCINLLRAAFKLAIRLGLCDHNPVRDIELEREERIDEPWDYLRPTEQHAMLTCEAMPEPERVILAFAMGTGLRPGEQRNLELKDLIVEGPEPTVVVRYGSEGDATKAGRIRYVPLFGLGLAAAKRWLEILPTYAKKNPHKLVFPTRRGKRRDGLDLPRKMDPETKKQPTETQAWRAWLAAAAVEREMRWYDATRHTFASSLVSGFWGRRWSLEEVAKLLGHTDIKMTQRYAHLADEALRRAARETDGGDDGDGGGSGNGRGNGWGDSRVMMAPNDAKALALITASGAVGQRFESSVARSFQGTLNRPGWDVSQDDSSSTPCLAA